ncbi:hypothetical protein BJ878DRAFT_540545 [Calycina marina]|uniref:AB hydrolase-1 domain-containing protein n=1 Tax=Calycina marina TaxID=1763456 RepID=A0A9P7Z6U3_9HELO|nr:hypothetical protein BJ878DRAFT_540545 [Calycina marina]
MPSFDLFLSKPGSPISYNFYPAIKQSPLLPKFLIVFINGLELSTAGWFRSINLLRYSGFPVPAVLTYDRFGQGHSSSRDPLDVTDLHELLITIPSSRLNVSKAEFETGKVPLLLVGHSIGGPIIRLYVEYHPGLVAGAVILDSSIANVDYSDSLPNPDTADFDPESVTAQDCTLEQYRKASNDLVKIFDLKVKNTEFLDRTTGPEVLPYDDKLKLVGVGGEGPWLSIVGHDPVTYAEDDFEKMGTPKSMSMKFSNAYWAKYNQGLTKITNGLADIFALQQEAPQ